jgi:short-subunit dehydrogenase
VRRLSNIDKFGNAFGILSSLAVLGVGTAFFGGWWLVRYLRPRYSPMVLNGAVVVITGASSGIGRAYAMAFARRGAKLVLVARRGELLEELRREIEPYAAEVLIIPADIAQEAARADIIRQTVDRFGRIGILINNAGQVLHGPLETYEPHKIEELVQVNLTAAMALTRHAIPSMLTRRRGIVVNVASVSGRVASIGYSVYAASKHGLLGFSDALRRDLYGTGVEVLSVLPGYTRTEMNNDKFLNYVQNIGMSIFEADEVAEATIKAILNGQHEVFIAGPALRVMAYMDRRYPNLTSVLMQAINSPMNIHRLRHQQDIED